MANGAVILALDLGSDIGVCRGAAGAAPVCDTWRLPRSTAESKRDLAEYFNTFEDQLIAAINAQPHPEIIAWEAPIVKMFFPGGKGSYPVVDMHATKRLIGLAVIAEKVGGAAGLRCMEAQPATVKKCLAGNGRANKADMMAAARRRGFTLQNEHEGDACGVWLHVVEEHFREHAAKYLWGVK